jgi:hypothetical protein
MAFVRSWSNSAGRFIVDSVTPSPRELRLQTTRRAHLGAVVVAAGSLALPGCTARSAATVDPPISSVRPNPAAPSPLATPATSARDLPGSPARPACLPAGPVKSLGVSGTQLAVCVDVTCTTPAACVAYDIPTRLWSRLDVPFSAEGASPQGASCGAAEGPVLPPRFLGPERPALWNATVAGKELRACPAPGASDCLVLKLLDRWTTPPHVVVSADRTGAVIWGSPDGKRRAAEIYDGRSGRHLRALDAFPGNRRIAPFDVEQVGYWGNVLWATWPAAEGVPESQTWIFDAQGHDPRLLGQHEPAYARYDDRLEVVEPHALRFEEGKVVLLDRQTGAVAATYPFDYRDPESASLLAIGKGQLALVFDGRRGRVDRQGDEDRPRIAEFLVLDIEAAKAGRPVVQVAGLLPRCEAEKTP